MFRKEIKFLILYPLLSLNDIHAYINNSHCLYKLVLVCRYFSAIFLSHLNKHFIGQFVYVTSTSDLSLSLSSGRVQAIVQLILY